MADGIKAFMAMGFNALEAEVYTFLLQHSSSTGYRVAQSLGKPAANVYKALESLESKGAVLVDRGASRSCRAVPADELLNRLETDFRERRERAAQAAAELKAPGSDAHVYALRSYEQVLERCRAMLARCRKVVLLDIFPALLPQFQPDIEAAAARGCLVNLKAYLPVDIRGVDVVLNPQGERLLEHYPGSWIILLGDGAELLIASVTHDDRQVQQAIWTDSATLAWMLHCSLTAEIMLAALCGHIARGATQEQLQAAILPMMEAGVALDTEKAGEVGEAIRRFRASYARDIPGYQALMAKFGRDHVALPDPAEEPARQS